MIRRISLLLLCASLAACGGDKNVKKPKPQELEKRLHMHGRVPAVRGSGAESATPDYTPGGLYKPGVPDSGPAIPPDISHLKEPVPKDEPLSKYGNRSPYTVLGKSYHVMKSADGYVERGIASWYGEKFHGRATSSMEPYDMYQFTAAHKTLPLPTYVRVTNLENGRSVVVKVNDRGPFHDKRLIDLSYAAAVKLGVHVKGTAQVEVRALKPGDNGASTPVAQTAPAAPSKGNAPPAATTNKPAATSKDARFWVQAGSFGERSNARRLMEKLEAAHAGRIEMQEAHANGRTVYRVRIGPFPTRDAAAPVVDKIRSLGVASPALVAD